MLQDDAKDDAKDGVKDDFKDDVKNDFKDDVKDGGLGCCQTFRFFLKHSFRDVARRKCHFCLGLCSVMIVVLSTLVVNTIVAKGPIIFMKLA